MRMLTLSLLVVGCVPKGKYIELQSQLDATRTELQSKLEAEAGRVTELDAALKAEQAGLQALKVEIAGREERIAELERQYTEALSDRSKLKASVDEMQAALRDLQARRDAAEARITEFKDLLSKFKSLIDAGRLKVKIVDGRMVVELASDILFDSGSAALSVAGKAALAQVAQVLADIQDRHFQVEGHTDNVPIKTDRFPSNWELGAARAITVVATLQSGGVPASRLSAASYSEFRPVQVNSSDPGKAANRRIEIVVVPDLSLLPGYDELQKLSAQ
jgi:chemotaxis protein MotB